VGNGFTAVVAEAEPVHPFPSVTVTVKAPAVLTEIVCVVAPLVQLYAVYDPASNVVELPAQNAKVPLIEGVGNGFITVVAEAEPVQPFPSVTVTVNVAAVLTEIVCVVAPPVQLYAVYIPASNVVELPAQNVKLPLTDGVGNGFIVVVAEAEPVHPFPSLTVTVKVPAVLTEIVWVVAPPVQL
jgi:hypothetical protein